MKTLIKWGISSIQTLLSTLIKDEKVLVIIQVLFNFIVKVIEKLTDDNKNNTEQIKQEITIEIDNIIETLIKYRNESKN
jgi:hypothetical protein